MVTTFADIIYKEISFRGYAKLFSQKDEISKNRDTLDVILSEMNITKSRLSDIDLNEQGTSLYLTYLLQTKEDIDFGICRQLKIWKNKQGWQYGCGFDKGKERRIQVYCHGHQARCERLDDLKKTDYYKI